MHQRLVAMQLILPWVAYWNWDADADADAAHGLGQRGHPLRQIWLHHGVVFPFKVRATCSTGHE